MKIYGPVATGGGEKHIFEEYIMTDYKSYDDLPLALGADEVAAVLGISRSNAYSLFHRKDFPTLHIGKRLIVPREKFIQWINDSTE